ncbi:MAG TPA: helix-turn-helix transcriptional regulator [Bacteroidia bacterium]|nr:helix-turn-helix transcriptional regulator [Bacteroidia bacterium]
MKRKPISKEEKLYLKKLGKRFRKYRTKAGHTSSEYFAYENDISRTQYGKYEAGGNIQFSTLVKILKGLNVTFEEFFKDFD